MVRQYIGLALIVAALSIVPTVAQIEGTVRVVRLPAGGIQPQIAADSTGTIHVVYFAGNPSNGDFFYTRVLASGALAAPIRVNSQAGSAIATGTVRGARIAAGRNDRIHIAWNGSSHAQPKGPNNATPMLYSRLSPKGDAFEPQRNLIQ